MGALRASGVLAGSTGIRRASPEIFWQIRVPRVLAGFGAGAALALAGALMQLLTRNALADPYVLGVAGGASVGALGTMLVAGSAGGSLSEWGVAGGAAIGASLAASSLLFAPARGGVSPAPTLDRRARTARPRCCSSA